MAVVAASADLEARFQPHFAEAWASEGHENVTLVSACKAGRVAISLNACVFASVSSWCYDMLKVASSNDTDSYYIITDLTALELEALKRLATTGRVVGANTVDCNQTATKLVAHLGGRLGLCAASDSSSGFSQLSPDEEWKTEDVKHIIPKVEKDETAENISDSLQPSDMEWAEDYPGISLWTCFSAYNLGLQESSGYAINIIEFSNFVVRYEIYKDACLDHHSRGGDAE